MPIADNHRVRLHWELTGEGTPVLLIMGHRYTARMWYPILADLAAKHRVITFDNRGVGESGTTSGAGHNFFVAAGQRANEAVLDFLDDVDRGAPIEGVRDA